MLIPFTWAMGMDMKGLYRSLLYIPLVGGWIELREFMAWAKLSLLEITGSGPFPNVLFGPVEYRPWSCPRRFLAKISFVSTLYIALPVIECPLRFTGMGYPRSGISLCRPKVFGVNGKYSIWWSHLRYAKQTRTSAYHPPLTFIYSSGGTFSTNTDRG